MAIQTDNKSGGSDPSRESKAKGGMGASSSEAESERVKSSSAGPRPSSINEALRMLDQALSRDGANLRELVSSEYSSLRQAIEDMAPKMGAAFREYGSQAANVVQDYAGQGIERGKRVADQVDTRVRENPWPVIGGVALGSFAIGFLFGRGGPSASAESHEELH